MAIVLENKDAKMGIYHLAPDIPGLAMPPAQKVTKLVRAAGGIRRPKISTHKPPPVLTLRSGEKSAPMHESVLRVPQIKRAVAAGRLAVLSAPSPAPSVAARAKTSKKKG